jgi:hypothetical protein
MITWSQVTRADVVRAIEEYDRFGPQAFFARHGFGPARTYLLCWNGPRYPSKAILGTAHKLATGQALGSDDFEGGKDGAAAVMRNMGFVIESR